MVFGGGWRTRRRGYGGYGGYPGYGGPGGWRSGGFGGYGGGGSCLRDMFLVESGCCLAEMLGCGPQLLLVAPRELLLVAPRALARRTRPHDRAPGALVDNPDHRGLRARLTAWLLNLISVYQREISASRPATCRYSPTCSHYAEQALRRYGLGRGLWLATRRLVRCRPGAPGGPDPLP